MVTPAEHSSPVEPSFLRKWLPLAILLVGILVVVIDSTVLNVSIGPIVRDLHISLTQIQWVISAYSLALGALLITGGRLGDVFGRKRMFLVGAVIFATGSVLASYSHTFTTLLIGESVIEGFGAALMSPATSSLLVSIYKGRDRALAYGFWGAAGAIGLAAGPLLGGFFATHSTWRWSFRINLFVVLVLLIGSRLLPKDTDFKDHRRFDWLGVFLSALGVFTAMFAIIESATYGIIHEKAPIVFFGQQLHFFGYSLMPLVGLLGLGILALFMVYESWRETRELPILVSTHIFQKRQFTAGTVSYGLYAVTQVSLMFTLAIFFQTVGGLNSLKTGYVYLPIAGALVLAAPLSGWLSTKIAPRAIIQVGFALQVIQALYVRGSLGPHTTVAEVVPAMLLAGIGLGALTSQVANLTLSAVPVTEAGEASGIMQTFLRIGGALGIAVTGALILSVSTKQFVRTIQADSRLTATEQRVVVDTAARQGASLEFEPLQLPANAPYASAVRETETQAVVDGNKSAFLLLAVFGVLGLISSVFLPKRRGE